MKRCSGVTRAPFALGILAAVLLTSIAAAAPAASPFVPRAAKLVPNDASADGSSFGVSVDLSGDGSTAVIGGSTDNLYRGAAWVFNRAGSTWSQQAKLAPGDVSGDESEIGTAVAVSADGRVAVVGGPGDAADAGAAWVFTRSGSSWQPAAKLRPRDEAGDGRFGSSVAVSANGGVIVVGAPGDAEQLGAAWVFIRSGAGWGQQGAKLTPRDERGIPRFGWAVDVSADGTTAIVGGPAEEVDLGAAWIFTRTTAGWSQQARLVPRDDIGATAFGRDVSLSPDGAVALIGGPGDDRDAGAAWIFLREGTVWRQNGTKLTPTDAEGGFFGASVALSDNGLVAAIGGPGDRGDAGAAWTFSRAGTRWSQQGEKLVVPGEDEDFGYSVALSAAGAILLIGGPTDAEASGAVWPFENTAPPPAVVTAFAGSAAASPLPRAGRRVTVSVSIRRTFPVAVSVGCTAKVAGAKISTTAQVVGPRVLCSMHLPARASGKRLTGTISVTTGNRTIVKSYAFPIQ